MLVQRVLSYLLWLCCLAFSISTHAEDAKLTFPVVNYPPYIIISDDGESISGIDIEITKKAFAMVGIDVDFSYLPWKRIVKSMQLGLIPGTVSCSRRPSRIPYMLFSDELTSTSRIVLSRKELDTSSIHSIRDLANFSVVSVDGWGMEQQLIALGIPHTTAPDIEGGLKAVRYRNIDLLYMAEYPALYQAKKLGIRKDVKVTPIVTEPVLPLYLCLSKQYPESQELLLKFNQGLQQIKANGTYQAIRAKYL